MLDVTLDGIFKTSVERIDLRALGRDDLFALIGLALENLSLSYDEEQVLLARNLWARLGSSRLDEKWSRFGSLQAFAALTSVQLMIQASSDALHRMLEPRAESLGASLGVRHAYVANFAEEVIRSHGLFCLSKLVDALAAPVREAAGVGPWRWVSYGEMVARGKLTGARSLSSIPNALRDTPRVLVIDEVDGTEDLTADVSAVITAQEVDLLSHVAIRARAGGILLATCLDGETLARLRQQEGAFITLRVRGDSVDYELCHADEAGAAVAPVRKASCVRARAGARGSRPGACKSGNLARLASRLPDLVRLPHGVALGPELLERALDGAPQCASAIRRLESELVTREADTRSLLAEIRETVAGLPLVASVVAEVHDQLTHAGLVGASPSGATDAVCHAMRRVWASLWNDRAHSSRSGRGVSREEVRMGVLIQRTLPAEYAFVVHTRHPLANDPRSMLVEVVVGLGEMLAGNAPGTPLRATIRRDRRALAIESYPSKPLATFDSTGGGTLIVRSDSSDEDQRDFSGAGLYDSCFVDAPRVAKVSYAQERLFWDEGFQRRLLESIARMAEAVESAMDAPQDIEGVYRAGQIYVVQTRDQVSASALAEPAVVAANLAL
jgi:alpha-glucan,water dikinase